MNDASDYWRRRLSACVDAKDEHFEQHLGLSIHSLLRQSWQQITKKHTQTRRNAYKKTSLK